MLTTGRCYASSSLTPIMRYFDTQLWAKSSRFSFILFIDPPILHISISVKINNLATFVCLLLILWSCFGLNIFLFCFTCLSFDFVSSSTVTLNLHTDFLPILFSIASNEYQIKYTFLGTILLSIHQQFTFIIVCNDEIENVYYGLQKLSTLITTRQSNNNILFRKSFNNTSYSKNYMNLS